ncbi:MAG: RluA family pseudouridine synthase [Bacteriovoracaceae bacterium]
MCESDNSLIDTQSTIIEITDEDLAQFKRLDHFLVEKTVGLSRSTIKSLFEAGEITSDEMENLSLKKMPAQPGKVVINIPPPPPTELEPQNIPIEILFEDEHLIFLNKPQGLVVHPAPGHPDKTLINAVLYHCPDIEGVGEEKRPGLVHRLDKGTSGVMVMAKNISTHRALIEKFSKHDLERRYECICIGPEVPAGGKIETQIGRSPTNRIQMSLKPKVGKIAITHYKNLKSFGKIHHVECLLHTGRTHQIRVHMSQYLKASILGDELYGNPKQQIHQIPDGLKSLPFHEPYLHAKVLGIEHPVTKEVLRFETEPPEHFQKIKSYLYEIS